ncbi:Ferric/cupric reductase transmembrane component 1 [Mycena indigotica]|uniref:Ferric/cupric reductase transmembrane component 1 n=1 Tax=Mycena indigotica TaxID=2126181 RepID=A0A8H6T079_9AGAR|nr:Ferric/cupric reductase transmembrane component 1 [Mycena indigotica]KAF7309283.1 Ferric/cupric reductase transmembrane component 1 [Mycena indigotica]
MSVLAQKPDPDRTRRIFLSKETPKQVAWFVAAFIALVTAAHLVARLHARLTRNRPPAPLEKGKWSWRRVPLALLNVYRTVVFRWTLNVEFWGTYTINVADFMLAGVYFTALFCWTFVNTTNSKGMKYDPKYWANRCAHIAAAQLPLMAALGMKNNPIAWLTGVSFDKLEYLHRATARVLILMFWVHGIGRVRLPHGSFEEEYWFRIGTAGTSALTLLALMSVRPARVRHHEAFMYAHAALGVLGLAGSYIHCARWGYPELVWPAMFVWGLDRVLRLLRIGILNSQLVGRTPRRLTSDAHVTVLPNPGFLRVLVDAPPLTSWRPGQSMYVTLVGAYPGSILEAHPFTIANVPGWDALLINKESEEKTPALSTKKLLFIIRVRTGFTRKLRDSVLAAPNPSQATFPALLDGPYSAPPDLRGYDSVLFICGGSGVSFALPLLLDLIHAATQQRNPRCTRAILVWAVRETAQVDWIQDTLSRALDALGSSPDAVLNVEVRVHVTAAPEYTQDTDTKDVEVGEHEKESDVSEKSSTSDATPAPDHEKAEKTPGVQLVHGRPDVDGIITSEIARMKGGALSVNVCGTAELARGVRSALSNPISRFSDVVRGGPSVVLHVEGFGNA